MHTTMNFRDETKFWMCWPVGTLSQWFVLMNNETSCYKFRIVDCMMKRIYLQKFVFAQVLHLSLSKCRNQCSEMNSQYINFLQVTVKTAELLPRDKTNYESPSQYMQQAGNGELVSLINKFVSLWIVHYLIKRFTCMLLWQTHLMALFNNI